MDSKHIKTLLERYFQGQTSLDEERQLRRYFSEGPIAKEHLPYRDLFRFFSSSQEDAYKGDIVPLPASRSDNERKSRRFRIKPAFWRAAAAVILAMSAWWLYPEPETVPTPTASAIDWSKYEPATPEEAFQTTSNALMSISTRLNYGAKKAAKKVSEVQRIF